MASPTLEDLLTDSVRHATGVPDAQPRPGQLSLAREAWAVLEEGAGHLVGRAPTGVGKALAGLVPAALLAITTGGRTVVSTESLALQGQMVGKDFPALASAVRQACGRDLSIAVLKGWSNYVCLRSARAVAEADRTSPTAATGPTPAGRGTRTRPRRRSGEEAEVRPRMSTQAQVGLLAELEAVGEATGDPLLAWALGGAGGGDGDRASYPGAVTDQQWSDVSVGTEECDGVDCPLRDLCYPTRARARAAAADIVVTNHSVLAVQATKAVPVVHGSRTLGRFDAVILDEAHALPQAVRNAGAIDIGHTRVLSLVRALERSLGVSAKPLPSTGATDADIAAASLYEGTLLADQLLATVSAAAAAAGGDRARLPEGPSPIADVSPQLQGWCEGWAATLARAIEAEADEDRRMRTKRLRTRLRSLVTDLKALEGEGERLARWFELPPPGDGDLGAPAIKASPVDVSGMLDANVWSRPAEEEELEDQEDHPGWGQTEDAEGSQRPARVPLPVIALSATVPAAFPADAGLAGPIRSYPSPFTTAYARSLLYVPRMGEGPMPVPVRRGRMDTYAHPQWAAHLLLRLVEANRGHALVLSAARAPGEEYAARLRAQARGRWRVLSQWDGRGRDVTTADWRADPSAVLVGTRSYMTGVDAVGTTCSLVVVDRVPRQPPNVVDDARAEVLASTGRTSTWQAKETVYGGDAALLLEQAAGRLIRSVTDHGLVAVLDPRLRAGSEISFARSTAAIYRQALGAFETTGATLAQACEYLEEMARGREAKEAA